MPSQRPRILRIILSLRALALIRLPPIVVREYPQPLQLRFHLVDRKSIHYIQYGRKEGLGLGVLHFYLSNTRIT